jgi:hypothetical protein
MRTVKEAVRPTGEDREESKAKPAKAGKRVTINLGPETVKALESISDDGAKSCAAIIRDAIWLEEHATALLREGGNF